MIDDVRGQIEEIIFKRSLHTTQVSLQKRKQSNEENLNDPFEEEVDDIRDQIKEEFTSRSLHTAHQKVRIF